MKQLKRDPFWEERTDLSATETAYNQGWDDGYLAGQDMDERYRERVKKLEEYIEQLENLLSANVRVMKAEIKREMAEDGC